MGSGGPGWTPVGPSWVPVGPNWGPFGNAAWGYYIKSQFSFLCINYITLYMYLDFTFTYHVKYSQVAIGEDNSIRRGSYR